MSSSQKRLAQADIIDAELEGINALVYDIRVECGLNATFHKGTELTLLELSEGDVMALISDLRAAKRLLSYCKKWAQGTSDE